ncbi:class I SAM-dependent methyltransferase [Pyrobaculum aerophilum]|uniref:class I SAM-dependent methyltransferase n=1 Tax=Pyrobaculum aerophilum TaxID=13773 RepID=UPI0015F2806E|nr:class I SAM-dependent methyltransferase [Pyrobaculum aerophilum]
MESGLEELYAALRWASRPGDPRAERRFIAIYVFMKSLAESGVFNDVVTGGRVKILDVMAASGIGGSALARVFVERGCSAELYVTDLRAEELGLAPHWLSGLKVEVKTAVADATKLPEVFPGEKFDVVLAWGSSMAHLDVFQLPLLMAGAREIQPPAGILMIQQRDILPAVLFNNAYRHVRLEGDLLSIHKEHDWLRGIVVRYGYKMPELKYIGMYATRLWEVAQIVSYAWIFYKDVFVYDFVDPIAGPSKVVIARKPRESAPAWRELLESLPT